ncbi:MAG: retropepsin-like aspartic protease [Roseibacillus sp.]
MRSLFMIGMALWLSGLPTLAEEEWKYRFFTRVLNAQTGKPLEEPITAEIKIVSKIDDHTFKAVIRDNTKAFRMDAKLFSLADQDYLRKWNPTFAIDLRDFPIEKVLEQSGYDVVDLQQKSLAFYVPVTLNGQELTFLVDTGAMGTFLDLSTVKRLKLPAKPSRTMVAGIGGIAGRAMEATYQSFKIGDVPITGGRKKLLAINLPFSATGGRLDGILGFELLQQLGGMIDYKSKRLFLRPRPEAKPEPTPKPVAGPQQK